MPYKFSGDLLVITLAALLFGLAVIDSNYADWTALVLIIIAGIPHGSFDLRVAERKWHFLKSKPLLTIVLYVAIGLAMSVFCFIAPTAALLSFLLVSAIHFAGGERLSGTYVKGTAEIVGISSILLPILLHYKEASAYMAFFIPIDKEYLNPQLALTLGILLSVSLVVILALNYIRNNRRELLQLTICLIGWYVLSPLAGFCIWFIGRHSRHHLEECAQFFKTSSAISSSNQIIPWDFLAISITAILLIVPLSFKFDFTNIHELFAASIILIAGLTLPHVLVTLNIRETLKQS
jgi:Brp/Blh family beta-carotene 15,15'-monooxygenase